MGWLYVGRLMEVHHSFESRVFKSLQWKNATTEGCKYEKIYEKMQYWGLRNVSIRIHTNLWRERYMIIKWGVCCVYVCYAV